MPLLTDARQSKNGAFTGIRSRVDHSRRIVKSGYEYEYRSAGKAEQMKRKTTGAKTRRVSFRITTMHPLPVGEQVFVTGNANALGSWNPASFALARNEDLVWTGDVMVPADAAIHYKITRGSWETEEVLEDGSLPDNHTISPGNDVTVEHNVHHWHDRRVAQPKIAGDYRVHEHMQSAHLRHKRTVIVWLPPSYGIEPDRRYPVLYMHDGQQVFDPATSTSNQDWEVDEWCTKLIHEKRLQEIIVVGIYSSPDRFVEYNPSELGEAYTRFVLEELKPFIDGTYRTRTERDYTAVAGSSMGGAISFYMAWTHPEIFFGAACLSSAFQYRQDRFTLDLVKATDTPPDLRLFLYCGQGDELEKQLTGDLHAMRAALADKGIVSGEQLLISEDPEGMHNEATWATHTDHWLLFLFGQ